MKKRKILTIVIAVVLVLLLSADLAGGNFLVSFAVGRTTSGGAAVVPEAVTTNETRSVVQVNAQRVGAETKEWYETVSPEAVSLTSHDGLKLFGELCVTDETSHRWALLVHGYTANHLMMWNYGAMFARQGYNLLLPDMRGHGQSEGNYIGMGTLDRKDIVKWIDLIVDRDPEAEIVLLGVSMGGATVTVTSGETLPDNVKAIVEDCGYTSVWDIFSDEMKALFHLPDFPLLYTADLICRVRAGYGFHEASAREQVTKATVPMLFIHGAEDNFVHTEMVYKLYEACPTEKDLYVVENAGHGEAYLYDPETYETVVFGFLSKVS